MIIILISNFCSNIGLIRIERTIIVIVSLKILYGAIKKTKHVQYIRVSNHIMLFCTFLLNQM